RNRNAYMTNTAHVQHQSAVPFTLANPTALDLTQDEAAGFHRAEDKHGSGRGRYQPYVAQEMAVLPAFRPDRRTFPARHEYRHRGDCNQRHRNAEGQETAAAQP